MELPTHLNDIQSISQISVCLSDHFSQPVLQAVLSLSLCPFYNFKMFPAFGLVDSCFLNCSISLQYQSNVLKCIRQSKPDSDYRIQKRLQNRLQNMLYKSKNYLNANILIISSKAALTNRWTGDNSSSDTMDGLFYFSQTSSTLQHISVYRNIAITPPLDRYLPQQGIFVPSDKYCFFCII